MLLRKAKPRNQTCFTSSDGNVMGLDFRTQTFLKIDDALVVLKLDIYLLGKTFVWSAIDGGSVNC